MTLIIQTLEYLSSSSDCSIRVFCQQEYVLLERFVTSVCCIRVFQRSSVYKSVGFIHLGKFTYLNMFMIQLAQKYLDNGGPTASISQSEL